MNCILFVVFISWLHVPVHATTAYIVPEKINTQAGASYVLMIKHDTIEPIECYVQNGTQKYSIELFRSGISPSAVPNMDYTIQPRASDSDIITSLGNGICGFKVDSVAPSMETLIWNLSFVDQSRNIHSAVANVVVRPTFPRHVVQYIKLGNDFFVLCPSTDPDVDLVGDIINCKLFNPQNLLVISDNQICRHSVKQSIVSDFGVWKCLLTYVSHMLPTEITFEIMPQGVDVVQTWTNVTDNHVNVGCIVMNNTRTPNYCVMVRPDNEPIVLRPGLATKRYTAIDTIFTKSHSVCAMQIVQPLEESEKGLWRCEQNYGLDAMGGFINVSAESSRYKPETKLPTDVFAHINSTLALKCEVPFSSTYCYMRGPDGVFYPLNDYRQTSLGMCDFDKKAQLTDNGTWICGFGMQTGVPDLVFTFQVHIPLPMPIQPEVQEVESRTAGIVRLVCTTKDLGGYPLKYCRFLSPDGHMYLIENHQMSDRISYAGRGLEYGDCGIALQDVSESDQGTWSCITRLDVSRSEEIYTNIHLTINDSLSVASTLGISIGVAAIVIISTVFFLHRYHKHRNNQTVFSNSAAAGRVSQDSNASSLSQDAIFNVLQVNAGARSSNATNVAVRYSSGNVQNPIVSERDTDRNGVELDNMANNTNQYM